MKNFHLRNFAHISSSFRFDFGIFLCGVADERVLGKLTGF